MVCAKDDAEVYYGGLEPPKLQEVMTRLSGTMGSTSASLTAFLRAWRGCSHWLRSGQGLCLWHVWRNGGPVCRHPVGHNDMVLALGCDNLCV